ncbi:MAG: STAS domain-containing protein [Actinomycetes bacterium]
MEIDVTTRQESGCTVVTVVGEVDVYTAPTLDEALSATLAEGNTCVVVDMTGVDFLDSTGLSVLVKALKRIREADGSLDVVVSVDRVAKVFRLTGLDKVIPLHAALADALDGDRADAPAANYDESITGGEA